MYISLGILVDSRAIAQRMHYAAGRRDAGHDNSWLRNTAGGKERLNSLLRNTAAR